MANVGALNTHFLRPAYMPGLCWALQELHKTGRCMSGEEAHPRTREGGRGAVFKDRKDISVYSINLSKKGETESHMNTG